ncbi:putative AAA family ATPase [Vibrio phage 168E36-1]|nr:putative AAA family ATPase [Vibrio phage 168E36-1]
MTEKISDTDALKAMLSPVSEVKPCIVTLMAEGGMGKTTLGAMFPNPVFMRFEDGTSALHSDDADLQAKFNGIQELPIVTKAGQEHEQLRLLGTTDHPFKTLVVDTISAMNTLYEDHIVDTDSKKPKSINQADGGYGAGHMAVSRMHGKFRERCERLREVKGMNIVFLCHVDTVDIELPDTDRYMRYSLSMNKKSLPHYTNNVDLVGHIKLLAYTFGDGDRKKVSSNGQRVLTCHPVASSITKNRYGITKDIGLPYGENPLEKIIPSLRS